MTLDIQFKLKSNPYYIQYLRENSYWYKILNRNPSMFNKFTEEVKREYHLRTSDKISKTLSTLEMLTNVVSNLK
jgi:hypothetical protein